MTGSERTLRQVLVNGAALLLAYALPRVFTLASVVFAARALGAEAFGTYGTAAAFAVISAVLAAMGMLPLLVREIARAPERAGALLRAAHVLKTATGAVMLVAAAIGLSVLYPDDPDVRAAGLVLCLGWVLNAYAENLAAYFQAIERMVRWTQASALFGFVSSGASVALLVLTGSLVAYCWGFVLGWGAALAWLLLGVPPDVRRAPATGRLRSDVLALATRVVPFAAAFIGLTLYCKVDVLLLERWAGPEQAGLFTAAYKFVDVSQALVIVAAGALFPRLARTADARHGGSWAGARSTELIVLAAVPFALALHFVARPVSELLFGRGYEASGDVLAWLALLLPFLAVSIHGGYVLAAAGRMLPVARLYAVGLAVNIALNAVLIPRFGAEGAALARLSSEALLVAGFSVALARHAGAAPGWRVVGATGALALAAGVALLTPDPTGGWLRAAAVLIVTAPTYRLARVVGAAELGRVRGAIFGAPRERTAEQGAG